MIKMPYTYLFYSIVALILFLTGIYGLLTHHVDSKEWYILLFPLVFSVIFLILFFKHKK